MAYVALTFLQRPPNVATVTVYLCVQVSVSHLRQCISASGPQFPTCDCVSLPLGLSFLTCDCVSAFGPQWSQGAPALQPLPPVTPVTHKAPATPPTTPGSSYSRTPDVETGWKARWGLRGWSPVSPHLSGCMAPGRDPQALVAGSGPGLYALPSTVGYINHDCTRVAGPAYSLFRRPSEGKAGVGEVGVQSPTQSISSPP